MVNYDNKKASGELAKISLLLGQIDFYIKRE